MRLHGLHLLATYGCNAACEHCFLSARPGSSATMDATAAGRILDSAAGAPIDHVFIEGGEPFLLGRGLLPVVEEIKRRGHWLGMLTNGFFASSEERAEATLRPLIDAGLDSLGVSTDCFHARYVPVERAIRTASTARRLGIEASIMFSDNPADPRGSRALLRRIKLQARGVSVWNGPVSCRGRAFTLAGSAPGTARRLRPWRTFDACREDHSDPSRVHIGPEGEIHLCQGLLLGGSALDAPLSSILSEAHLMRHPIASVLRCGGPAALAEMARDHGFRPAPNYPDGCSLCFHARLHLREVWPGLIAPASVYAGLAS